jgi:hypothetical protein
LSPSLSEWLYRQKDILHKWNTPWVHPETTSLQQRNVPSCWQLQEPYIPLYHKTSKLSGHPGVVCLVRSLLVICGHQHQEGYYKETQNTFYYWFKGETCYKNVPSYSIWIVNATWLVHLYHTSINWNSFFLAINILNHYPSQFLALNSQNPAVEWVVFLLYIQVTDSNSSLDTGNPDCEFCDFSQSLLVNSRNVLQTGYAVTTSLHILSNSLFTNHPNIQYYIVWATESIMR